MFGTSEISRAIVVGFAAILVTAGAMGVFMIQSAPLVQHSQAHAASKVECESDPAGPEIIGYNQIYGHHWVREGAQVDLAIQCVGGLGMLELWWEVDGLHVDDGDEFTFVSDEWGRGIHPVDAYCIDSAGFCAQQSFHIEVFDEDAFTIGLLPDTQFYTRPGSSQSASGVGDPEMFNAQTQWLVDMKEVLDVVWAAHLGDVIHGAQPRRQCDPPLNQTPPAVCLPESCLEDPPSPTHGDVGLCQYTRADIAMGTLDSAGVPFSIAIGNHDYGPPMGSGMHNWVLDIFDSFFPVSRWQAMVDTIDHYQGFSYFEDAPSGMLDVASNAYHLFEAGGMDFLLVAQEYAPAAEEERDTWLADVVQNHANRRVIHTNHFSNFATFSNLSEHPNVFLYLWGHSGGCPYNVFTVTLNGYGTPVSHRMGLNFQFCDYGGNGYMRFLVFEPSRDTISARTYSPYLDVNPNEGYPPMYPGEAHQFDFYYLMSSDSVPAFDYSGIGGKPSTPALNFNAEDSFSYGQEAFITDYEWNFGDGNFDSGISVNHEYAEPGPYIVELTVHNNLGQQATASREVNVPGNNWHGDADRDGYVGLTDVQYVVENFGQVTTSDVVGTGIIDEYDMLSVLCNWGRAVGDINRDCEVDSSDLMILFVSGDVEGNCPWPCPADIASGLFYGPDGVIDVWDQHLLLSNWGSYPGCNESPSQAALAEAEPYLFPEWIDGKGDFDASFCEVLNHWYGNPIYE